MRKIESQMLEAVKSYKSRTIGNTSVYPVIGAMEVSLHGHPIAQIDEYGTVKVDLITLKNWPTNTTKSRLRALGVDISIKAGVLMVNGLPIK